MSIDITTASVEELVNEAKQMINLIKDVYPDKSNRDQLLEELQAVILALSKRCK